MRGTTSGTKAGQQKGRRRLGVLVHDLFRVIGFFRLSSGGHDHVVDESTDEPGRQCPEDPRFTPGHVDVDERSCQPTVSEADSMSCLLRQTLNLGVEQKPYLIETNEFHHADNQLRQTNVGALIPRQLCNELFGQQREARFDHLYHHCLGACEVFVERRTANACSSGDIRMRSLLKPERQKLFESCVEQFPFRVVPASVSAQSNLSRVVRLTRDPMRSDLVSEGRMPSLGTKARPNPRNKRQAVAMRTGRTMKRLALLLIFAVSIAACGAGEPSTSENPTIEETSTTTTTSTTEAPSETTAPPEVENNTTFLGADGVESTIEDTSRIVSLNGDITEIISALGLGDQLVAVDVTTTYPPETDALPRVGFGQQLAPEGVLAFQPTVVIGDTQIAPSEAIEQIRSAGVPVVILDVQTTLDGVETKIQQIAEVLGVSDTGASLAADVNSQISTAVEAAGAVDVPPRVAYLYVRGPQQVFLFGKGMVTNALIEGAGAIDAAAESGVFGAVPLTPEALVAAAPDIIVAPSTGVEALGGVDALTQLPGVSETPAGANGAFLVYDDGFFLNFGPRTGEALEQLITDLYSGE